jgi:hypothetical protein
MSHSIEWPAIVPITVFNRYLDLLTKPEDGDLILIRESAVDYLANKDSDIVHQAAIPVRQTRFSREYQNLHHDCAGEFIDSAINNIRQLEGKHRYKRIIFLAEDSPVPLFAQGQLSEFMQHYITDEIYRLGIFVNCHYE